MTTSDNYIKEPAAPPSAEVVSEVVSVKPEAASAPKPDARDAAIAYLLKVVEFLAPSKADAAIHAGVVKTLLSP